MPSAEMSWRTVAIGAVVMLVPFLAVDIAGAELGFSIATRDEETYRRSPHSYEKVEPEPGWKPVPTYVERRSQFVIKDGEIEAVRIKERRGLRDMGEIRRQALYAEGGTGPTYYETTFLLSKQTAAVLNRF